MGTSRSLACIMLIASATVAGAQTGQPSWKAVENAIRADYAKRESSTKILEIAKGNQDLWPWWLAYEADVSVERSGGRRDQERVGVSFVLVNDKWELDAVELLGHRELADVKPPTAELAQQLLAAAWNDKKCEGYDVTAVKLNGVPRFQRDPNATDPATAKRSYIYSVDVAATGNGQFRMSERGTAYSNRTQNLLTWDASRKSWSVDPRQVRCSGWIKVSVGDAGSAGAASAATKPAESAGIAGSGTPSDGDAVKAFTQAWGKLRPDFTVTSIAVKSKDPHQYQDRRWINYKLAILVTGTDQGSKSMAGKKFLCEPDDYSSVLKWDAAASLWKVDESMVTNFNESSCTAKP